MTIICDNQVILDIVFYERSKHIEVECHCVREKIESRDIITI